MKHFIFYTFLAAMIALPIAAAAGEHEKVDCAKHENAEKEECKHHEGK